MPDSLVPRLESGDSGLLFVAVRNAPHLDCGIICINLCSLIFQFVLVSLITFIRAKKIIVVTIRCGMAEAVRDARDLATVAIAEATKLLGYRQLRAKQEQAITQFLKGNDVFVSLPTGSGKSLCYWILPYSFDFIRRKHNSMIIVVSPLIALMQEQVRILVQKGMKAVYVGGAHQSVVEDIKDGKFQVLFFSPECLLTELDWRDVLHSSVFREQLVAFVVDEAHCVKQW